MKMVFWCRVLLVAIVGVHLVSCSQGDTELAGGERVSLAQWDGRWLVINYWAEWCGPCRKEIPELNELHQDGESAGITVLGVNYDGLKGSNLVAVGERLGITFPVLAQDPRQMWGYELPQQLPTTVLISPQRTVHKLLVGPQTVDSLQRAMQAVTPM